jgi:FtsH-binding integral membrane protein
MTRVRVTAARTAARPAPPRPRTPSAAAEESDVGQVYVRSLIRSQLGLALVVACGFLVVLAACALLLGLAPGVSDMAVMGIPFSWLLLGAGLYPVIGFSAWLFNRAAARNEARYRDLVQDG